MTTPSNHYDGRSDLVRGMDDEVMKRQDVGVDRVVSDRQHLDF